MTSGVGADRGTLDLTEAGLAEWGWRFGASLEAPAVVGISGELGVGKTTLVQAICAGFGVTDQVTSPTFALVHAYQGAASPVFHLDLYRLDSPAQLTNLGWDEMLDARALVIVEWPERAGPALPSYARLLALAHLSGQPDRRRLSW
jgi:tRNA threonylcarbamoyladenosine biosynthesis protein TsaE